MGAHCTALGAVPHDLFDQCGGVEVRDVDVTRSLHAESHRNARAATNRAEAHPCSRWSVRRLDAGSPRRHVPQCERMAWLLLARHGETDWNREGRWQGHADVSLNERGRDQARELAQRLACERFDAIYSSDLARAHETALIVAEQLRMPVTTDAGLREIDVGRWSGCTPADIAQRFPGMTTHDGETAEQHLARVLGAFTRIASTHAGQRLLVVSHGKSLRVIRRHASGQSVSVMGNCETATLRFVDDRFVAD